jgi:hypothetical protein
MTTRPFRIAAVVLGVALGTAASLLAQAPGGFNIVTAPPKVNVQDKEDVWVLDFQFKSARVVTVDIPGRGRRTVYYLWYQVWNRTGQPRTFIPDFTLVTNRDTVHHDEVLPRVQEQIAKIEGVPGFDDIKNSVTIAAQPIPPTKPDSNPVYVTGVAIFPDVVERVPDLASFSIFVSGLSNGWSVDPNGMIRRKTLQLNFLRRADARIQDARAIKYEGQAWVYRSTGVKAPETKPAGAER